MSNITISNKAQLGQEPSLFKSRWDTTQAGSANDTVVLPLQSNGSYNFDVDWGDGNRDNITTYNQSEVTHQYSNTGIYEIRIKGNITGWRFNNGGDDDKITEISKWGPLRFVSNDQYLFNGCSNLISTATDSLTLGASNGSSMFKNCSKLGDQGNMNSWNTSSVTNMNSMFEGATGFNQPIGDWDTSSVTSMYGTFWNYLGGMTFDQDIGNWDTSSVTNMQFMFHGWVGNNAFDNGGSSSISGWDTSNVTNMEKMFKRCTSFNQPIGYWNTSKVTNMAEMLQGCNSFNQDLGGWDVTGVTSTFGGFFKNLAVFNNGGSTGINNWRPSSCTNMSSMFEGATGFNQPIGDWDTSSVTNMYGMFYNYLGNMTFDQDIGNWDTSSVTTMQFMFHGWVGNNAFDNGGSPSISGWDTSNVTDMHKMFKRCTSFNQPIGYWNTSKVTNMAEMLQSCNSFNQDLGDWDVSGVTNMNGMLQGCNSFNQDLSNWDVSEVTNMSSMFQYVTNFNNGGSTGINNWDTSSCTNMGAMFHSTTFNQPIGNWDTSSVTSIHAMFYNADAFDQDLSNWTVTAITDAGNFMGSANGLSTTNYDRTLSGWSPQSVQNGVNIHFGSSKYSNSTGLAFRNALVASGWTITDGGAV